MVRNVIGNHWRDPQVLLHFMIIDLPELELQFADWKRAFLAVNGV